MSDGGQNTATGADLSPRPEPRLSSRFLLAGLTGRVARPGELFFAIAFFAFALLLLLLLPWQTTWAPRTKLFVQPAFWPGIAILTMVLFSAGNLVVALCARRGSGVRTELLAWVRALEYVLWFLAYVWLVPRIAYLPATVLFACALSWRAGYRSARWMGIAAVFGLAVVVAFKGLLGVNIPAGAIYDLLPAGPFRSFLMTNF